MKRMTKIGIYGMAVWMLSACGNGTPDYDATGTFEATEVIVSRRSSGKTAATGSGRRNKIESRRRSRAGRYCPAISEKVATGSKHEIGGKPAPRSGQTDSRYQTANYYSAKGKEAGREPACCRSCQSETTG